MGPTHKCTTEGCAANISPADHHAQCLACLPDEHFCHPASIKCEACKRFSPGGYRRRRQRKLAILKEKAAALLDDEDESHDEGGDEGDYIYVVEMDSPPAGGTPRPSPDRSRPRSRNSSHSRSATPHRDSPGPSRSSSRSRHSSTGGSYYSEEDRSQRGSPHAEVAEQNECGGETPPRLNHPLDVFKAFGMPDVSDTPRTMKIGLASFIKNAGEVADDYLQPPIQLPSDPVAEIPTHAQLVELYQQFQAEGAGGMRPPPGFNAVNTGDALHYMAGSETGIHQLSTLQRGGSHTASRAPGAPLIQPEAGGGQDTASRAPGASLVPPVGSHTASPTSHAPRNTGQHVATHTDTGVPRPASRVPHRV
jgi:hypothetical protein